MPPDSAPPDVGSSPPDDSHLIPLGSKLRKAMSLRESGDMAKARDLYREILQADPRLAEPRLELAHMAAEREDWDEAEEQARAALDLLRRGGQWTADLPPERLEAFATNLLAEVLYRSVQDGELIFRDEEGFKARWNEAAALFARALELDPENEDAQYWANHVRPTT